jgi:acyl-coenzyme A thioesterase PaaI-like protein
MRPSFEDDHWCFACGRENPHGLRLAFERTGKGVRTFFTPEKKHQGWKDIVHGGILSTMLDEACAHAAIARGFIAPTAEIKIRFKAPLFVGEKAIIEGWVDELKETRGGEIKITHAGSEIRTLSGKLVATAAAKLLLRESFS